MPFLSPFIEIESIHIKQIKEVCKLLKLDFEKGITGGVGKLYSMEYEVEEKEVNSWKDKEKIISLVLFVFYYFSKNIIIKNERN